MTKILLDKSWKRVVKKLVLDPFLKNQNWAYLYINSLRFLQFVFTICQVEGCRPILKCFKRYSCKVF